MFGFALENGNDDRNSSCASSRGASSPATDTRSSRAAVCCTEYDVSATPPPDVRFRASHEPHEHPGSGRKNDSACASNLASSVSACLRSDGDRPAGGYTRVNPPSLSGGSVASMQPLLALLSALSALSRLPPRRGGAARAYPATVPFETSSESSSSSSSECVCGIGSFGRVLPQPLRGRSIVAYPDPYPPIVEP